MKLMHYYYRIIAVFIICFFCVLPSNGYAAGPSEEEINNVLDPAESLFKAMKDKQYPVIWTMITEKTKKKIIDSTYRELKKAGTEIGRDKIETDFQKGEAISQAYWDGYLLIFNPQLVLEHSQWTIAMMDRDKTEINIHFKKSKYPAVLKLFKENGQWKIGLHETFGARSLLSF